MSTGDPGQSMYAEAVKHAERNVYSLNNGYLTEEQKVWVEWWSQFPLEFFGIAWLSLMAASIGQDGSIVRSLITAFIYAGLFSLILWFFHPRPVLALGGLLVGWPGTIVALGFAAFFFFENAWMEVGISIAAAAGLTSILAPSTWIYSLLSRGMHPKYRFAKKFFGLSFPFE